MVRPIKEIAEEIAEVTRTIGELNTHLTHRGVNTMSNTYNDDHYHQTIVFGQEYQEPTFDAAKTGNDARHDIIFFFSGKYHTPIRLMPIGAVSANLDA